MGNAVSTRRVCDLVAFRSRPQIQSHARALPLSVLISLCNRAYCRGAQSDLNACRAITVYLEPALLNSLLIKQRSVTGREVGWNSIRW